MANQGIYREPGAVGGLPLPRTRIVPLTIVVALLAFVAVVLPQLLLAVVGRSAAGAWRLFRDGGMPMWLLLLLDLVSPVAIAVLGAFVLRGRRTPSALLFVLAALPFGVALLGAHWGQRMTMGAISGESVDPEQKARILAEGIAESMSCDIFGGFVVCGAALVAAAAAASALATIDVARITRGGPKPSSFGVIGAGAAGTAWVLATIVLGGLRLRDAGGLALLPVLPVMALATFAVLAGRGALVLRAWHDRAEASRAGGALVVAALSALLAVLALQRGLESSATARAFSAIAGESVDHAQRARILAEAIAAGHLAKAAFAIHAVLGTLTFALALEPVIGRGRAPLAAGAAIAVGIFVLLLGGTLGLERARTTAPRKVLTHDAPPGGVTLPVIVETFSDKANGSGGGERIVVARDGTGDGDPSTTTSCIGGPSRVAYADGAATLAMVRARFPPADRCTAHLTFVATRKHPADVEARLGATAAYLGTTSYFTVMLGGGFDDRPLLRVRSLADDAIEIDGQRFALPLSKNEVPRAGRFGRVTYWFRGTETVQNAIDTMLAVETLYAGRIPRADFERVLLLVVADEKAAAPSGEGIGLGAVGGGASGSLRPGTVQVNGRLPPEVVQRIVRQNFGRFRLCYENGLRKDPALQGRVTVKFVIDRSGSVSTAADGGSDLPDPATVACVVRGFGSLAFPQPEGGIVTVVYPLVFTPAAR